MFNQERIIEALKKLLPYGIILFATFIPLNSFLMPGIFGGTDAYAHFPYVSDLIYGIEHGFSGLSGGHLITGIFAYNVYQFYAPLPHYFVAYTTYLFSWTGINMMDAFKIVFFLSSFISNIFVYLLAKKMTKSDKIGVLFGILYAFFPYRLFCLMYRWAYPEAIAMGFVPIAFYGMYRILNDESPKVSAYVSIVVGVAGLILSHPYTALITVVALVVYFLANIMKVINVFKNKVNWLYIGVSIALIFGLIGPYFFPMIKAMGSEFYRLADNEIMWTNVPHIQDSMKESLFFGGLINFTWLKKVTTEYGWHNMSDSSSKWILELCVFVVTSFSSIILDTYLKKKEIKKPIRVAIEGLIVLVPAIFIMARIEVIFAAIVLVISFAYIDLGKEEDKVSLIDESKDLYKNPNVYASIVLLVFAFMLIFSPSIWEIMPSIFHMGQFAWRAWSLAGILLVFAFMIVASLAKGRNNIVKIIAFVSAFAIILAQGPIDKRIAQANGSGNVLNYSYNELSHIGMIGCQDEYMPIVFFQDGYTPTYENSLYGKVRHSIRTYNGFPQGIDNYYEPAFLEGTGTMNIVELNTPNAQFELEVTSDDAYIQLPQFYYDGYKLLANNKTIEVGYEDGLLSFHIEKGSYTVSLEYVGPLSYRIARPFFYISLVGLVGLGVGGYFLRKREEKLAN